MEFGVFILAQQRGYHQSSQDVIRNAVEQTVAAEGAGFDTAWYAEHHFNNYSLSPSPLMMVAHCAGLTKTETGNGRPGRLRARGFSPQKPMASARWIARRQASICSGYSWRM